MNRPAAGRPQLTVASYGVNRDAATVSEVVASLPISFRLSTSEHADVVAIGGTPGWAEETAAVIDSGGRVILITNPCPVSPADSGELAALAALAVSTGSSIVLSEGWAGNPVLETMAIRWAEPIRRATLIEVVASSTPEITIDDLIVREIRVLRALGLHPINLDAGVINETSFSLVGCLGEGARVERALVNLQATQSRVARSALEVIATSDTETVRSSLFSDRTARPGTGSFTTVGGRTVLPTIWQTAHRASFKRLHDASMAGVLIDDLTDFAADVATSLILAHTTGSPQPESRRGVAGSTAGKSL